MVGDGSVKLQPSCTANYKIWTVLWPLRCHGVVLRRTVTISDPCFKKTSGGDVKNVCPVAMAIDLSLQARGDQGSTLGWRETNPEAEVTRLTYCLAVCGAEVREVMDKWGNCHSGHGRSRLGTQEREQFEGNSLKCCNSQMHAPSQQLWHFISC